MTQNRLATVHRVQPLCNVQQPPGTVAEPCPPANHLAQAVKRSVYENDARIVRKGIDQVIREAQATANYLQLQATATGTLLQQEAEARGKQLKVLGQAEAYESLKESMGMTNSVSEPPPVPFAGLPCALARACSRPKAACTCGCSPCRHA